MSTTGLDEDYLIRAMQKDLDRILAEESGDQSSQFVKTREAMVTVLVDSVQTQSLDLFRCGPVFWHNRCGSGGFLRGLRLHCRPGCV
jgi:hypothetical protein